MKNKLSIFEISRLADEVQKRTSSIVVAARDEERVMTFSECMIIAHEATKVFFICNPEANLTYHQVLGKEISKVFKSRKRFENNTVKVLNFYKCSKLLAMGA